MAEVWGPPLVKVGNDGCTAFEGMHTWRLLGEIVDLQIRHAY